MGAGAVPTGFEQLFCNGVVDPPQYRSTIQLAASLVWSCSRAHVCRAAAATFTLSPAGRSRVLEVLGFLQI